MKYNNDENKLNEVIFTKEEIKALKILAKGKIERMKLEERIKKMNRGEIL